ncbi:MAG: HDOD domain-containing protein [Planctomycetota bacterium]|jgi:putative nucleotidyltransferase with HDIG domain
MKVTIRPSEITSLTPMPVSVVRLASLAHNANADMKEMAKIIEYDEALTANLLRVANSVWGGSRVPVMTVKDSIVRLGTTQVLKFAVGQKLSNSMSRAFPGYELGEHEHWRHSVAAALAAESLSTFLYKPIPGLAFTVSLIHDIGKLILDRHLGGEAIEEIKKIVYKEKIPFIEGERIILGTDHASVGGEIARHWKFPDQLVTAIELHHNPDQQPDALLDLVHLGNIVARLVGVGLGSEAMHVNPSDQAVKRMGIEVRDLEAVCAVVQSELNEADKLYRGAFEEEEKKNR